MAKLSLSLVPEPTFKLRVPFPITGTDPVPVSLVFKRRDRMELAKFMDDSLDSSKKNRKIDDDIFMDMVLGWDLEDEFSRENVEKLLGNHLGVAVAVFNAYVQALVNPGSIPKEWFVAKT